MDLDDGGLGMVFSLISILFSELGNQKGQPPPEVISTA
jgi:hypothetical protein